MAAFNLIDAAGTTGILAGAIVATLAASAGLGKLAFGFYRWTRRIEDSLAYVESEMRHNGGSTVRDAVTRIEHRQNRIEQHLGIVEEKELTP